MRINCTTTPCTPLFPDPYFFTTGDVESNQNHWAREHTACWKMMPLLLDAEFKMTPHSIKTTASTEQALPIFVLHSHTEPTHWHLLPLPVYYLAIKSLMCTGQLVNCTQPVIFCNDPVSSVKGQLQQKGICFGHCWIPNYSNSVSAIWMGQKNGCSLFLIYYIYLPLYFRSWTLSFHFLLPT